MLGCTHAAEVGGDRQRVAVAGDSAGGNLAAVVELMARDRGAPTLVHQLLVYPITNYSFDTASYRECGDGYLLTKGLMEWGWTNSVSGSDDSDNPYASPLRADDLSGLPAATIITAGFDPLRDEGQAHARRFQEAAVPADLKHYEGMIHAFWQLGGVLDQGRQVIDDAGAALRAAFRVQGAGVGSGPALSAPQSPERASEWAGCKMTCAPRDWQSLTCVRPGLPVSGGRLACPHEFALRGRRERVRAFSGAAPVPYSCAQTSFQRHPGAVAERNATPT